MGSVLKFDVEIYTILRFTSDIEKIHANSQTPVYLLRLYTCKPCQGLALPLDFRREALYSLSTVYILHGTIISLFCQKVVTHISCDYDF
jgi:hypothetical protein